MDAAARNLIETDPIVRNHAGFVQQDVERKLKEEIERVISTQTTPESFIVESRAVLPLVTLESDQAELVCEMKATVQTKTPPPRIQFQPGILGGSLGDYVPVRQEPTYEAHITQQLRTATDPLIGHKLTDATREALERTVEQTLLQNPPPPPPTTDVVQQGALVWDTETTGGLAGIYNTNHTSITINGNQVGSAGGTLNYRWHYPSTTATDHVGQPPGQVIRVLQQSNTGAANSWYTVTGTAGTGGGLAAGYNINVGDYLNYTGTAVTGWDHAYTMGDYHDTATGGAGGYTFSSDGTNWYYGSKPLSKQEQLRGKIRKQLAAAARKRNMLLGQVTPAELKARDTLRDMLSEADWRRYVTNSFIMVRGESRRWYQVFANHHSERIRVYEKGEHIASLCIHSSDECPLTDHVIAMKIQIELDEESVWKEANQTGGRRRRTPETRAEALGAQVLGDMMAANHDTMVAAAFAIPEGALTGGNMTNPYLDYATMAV